MRGTLTFLPSPEIQLEKHTKNKPLDQTLLTLARLSIYIFAYIIRSSTRNLSLETCFLPLEDGSVILPTLMVAGFNLWIIRKFTVCPMKLISFREAFTEE